MSHQTPFAPLRRRCSIRNTPSNKASPWDGESKENRAPGSQPRLDNARRKIIHKSKTPLTPVQNSLVHNLRERLELQLAEDFNRLENTSIGESTAESRIISPGLISLRMSPARKLRDKQDVLLKKHKEARSNAFKSSVGGGVSIWPEMDNMRLTSRDMQYIAACSIMLIASVIYILKILHGVLMNHLRLNLHRLKTFNALHPLDKSGTQQVFNSSLLRWHMSFTTLLDELTGGVEVSLSQSSVGYQAYLLLYVFGILTLIYYLADNVVATSRLTPHRTKIWISLLVVMGTWTLLMLQLLVLAQAVEVAVESNVHWLSSQLGDLVYLTFDLVTYRDLVTYWTTRCLPPTTQGTLSILGVLAVRDVSYYLQYYSLPVLTALLMPVGKLVLALKRVYAIKPHA